MVLAWSFFILSFCLSVALLFQILLRETSRKSSKKLPPGPRGWPVAGNLFDLGEIQTIFDLGKKYGPVMWLQLGAMNTVIIQSTEAAKEMFKNHDLIYSGRTITEAMRACSFNQGAMSVAQYGPYWRAMKRLCITELATNKQVYETAALRRNCIEKMIHWIEEEAQHKHAVCVAHYVFLMTFNLLGNLLLSRDLVDPKSKEGHEFFNAVDGLMQAAGQPNVADFFPLLKWVDPQGIRKKMDRHLGKAVQIVAGFVKERIEGQNSGEQKNKKDFLDALLEYEGEEVEPSKISERDMVIMIMEIFIAGTETTSSTIEWAIAELLRNSKTMSKVRKELEDVVGCRRIEESDIEELHYLQAVVKETLRLHPPIPFLVPRKAVKDNDFMGYHIPKDTQVLVNAWATGRDPDCWDDPLSFKPERFLGSDTDYRGQHFELIPFGAGRRICAGIPLAHRVLHLALGSLLHFFKWDLDDSVTLSTIDMKERMGITLRKKNPLIAIPRKQQ